MDNYYEVPEFSAKDIRKMARRSLRGKWTRALVPMIIIMALTVVPELLQYGWLIFNSKIDWNNTQSIIDYINSGSGGGGVLSNVMTAVAFFIAGPLAVSACALSLRILRNEDFSAGIVLTGFYKFFQSFFVYVLVWIFSMLWSLITVFPGAAVFAVAASRGNTAVMMLGLLVLIVAVIGYIYLILRYTQSYFIAADNRDLPATQSVAYSVTLMKGRAGRYFLLQLSFIGWAVLASIPFAAGVVFYALGADNSSLVMKISGIGLIIIGIITIAMLEVYIYTANAVFYSAVSGNFGISRPAPADYSGESPAYTGELPDSGTSSEDKDFAEESLLQDKENESGSSDAQIGSELEYNEEVGGAENETVAPESSETHADGDSFADGDEESVDEKQNT